MTQIVRSTYRYKRPPRKKKPVERAVPAIVTIPRKRGRKVAVLPAETSTEVEPVVKSAIVTTTSRKQSKLRRVEQALARLTRGDGTA